MMRVREVCEDTIIIFIIIEYFLKIFFDMRALFINEQARYVNQIIYLVTFVGQSNNGRPQIRRKLITTQHVYLV